ncbi:MAG: hypothetical protein ACEY26_00665 [Candidatus Hodgkinia cicadicola]
MSVINLRNSKFELTVRYITSNSDVVTSVRLFDIHPNSRDLILTEVTFANWAIGLIASRLPMLFIVCCAQSNAANCQQTSADVGSSFGFIFSLIIRKFKPIRYASVTVPINASLIRCNLDLCGRSSFRIENASATSADFTEAQALLSALTRSAGACLHVEVLKAANIRSMQEGIFKSIGMCLAAVLNNALSSPVQTHLKTIPNVSNRLR